MFLIPDVPAVFSVPVANLISASTYKSQLSLTGFEVSIIESARKPTRESFAKYVATHGLQEVRGISADADRKKQTLAFIDAWDKGHGRLHIGVRAQTNGNSS